MSKVASPTALKKRLDRFFFNSVPARTGLCEFVTDLTLITEAYVFGGLIRDIAFEGMRHFDSDVDIVYHAESSDAVMQYIRRYPHQVNKFGGVRFQVQSWQVDAWPIEQTWAFAAGVRNYASVNSLLETTITTWDSALYRLNDRRLILAEDFFPGLESGTLDLVLPENPNRLGLLVRLMRLLCGERVEAISPAVSKHLKYALQEHHINEIVEYEGAAYETRVLTKEFIKSVAAELATISDDSQVMRWGCRQRSLGL